MVVLTFQQKDPKKGFGIASVGQAKGITRFLVGEKGKGASGFLRFFFSANSFHQYQLKIINNLSRNGWRRRVVHISTISQGERNRAEKGKQTRDEMVGSQSVGVEHPSVVP